ncbi:phosphotriesterase-related protein isoform X3 [Linepithema humile]|nr:PREDICTED: phosphotriesterase-related protein-like isoform X2 [Linepithema humile]
MNNLSHLTAFPYSSKYNLTLNDIDTKLNSLNELNLFNQHGGKTIVENSSHGLYCDTSSLKIISKETGVNIIVGTGLYSAHAVKNNCIKVEHMCHIMDHELDYGCWDDSTVQAGFIGEIGVGVEWPLNDFEKNSIIAAATIQQIYKCSVSLSSGWYSDSPKEIMRIFQEAGGDANKVAMCYVDRTLTVKEDLLIFADDHKNCYLQFSLFGTECFMCQQEPNVDVLSDAQRIKRIKKLKENKYLDRVLISHNIHTKNKLRYFGGHGYSYILTNTKDHMLKNGLTTTDFDTILEENPKSWLT